MILYAENNQSIQCYKTNAPQINNEKSSWDYLVAVVDEGEIKFYYSNRYPSDSFDLFGNNKRRSGGYLYFQLDSQWYKLDVCQEIFYLGGHRFVDAYIYVNGSFTTKGMNERKDGVRYSNIAQFELISKNLWEVMKEINSYNPHIEVQVKDGKLSLINKLSNDHIVAVDK